MSGRLRVGFGRRCLDVAQPNS